MTHEEIESALHNHAGWIVHMRDTLDEATELIQKLAQSGIETDKRIAELAVAQKQTAEAHERTEKLLQKLINSRLTNGHGKTEEGSA